MIFQEIKNTIISLKKLEVSNERKLALKPLINYIQSKVVEDKNVNLNFICTHNSRRSHLSQVWAQVAAHYFNVKNVRCYSGGTEATAMFPMAGKALELAGLKILKLTEGSNPVYSIKYDENEPSIIAFSKTYDNEFNPKSEFAAIMTCNNADVGCPIVLGAEARFPVKYDDPKSFDNTPQQAEKYTERSNQIVSEMLYVFSKIKK